MTLAVALSVAAFVLRLGFLERRGFNPDEFQHLHSAWCISKGLLPYRDYFEHHTPWLHLLIAPFFTFYDVERDPEQATHFIFAARRAMWVSTGIVLVATFWVGRLAADARVGWLAVVLLGNTIVFLAKTLEIRPDVPATACLMLGIGLAMAAASRGSEEGGRRAIGLLALSGFLAGAAVLFTQKMLFALPGWILALAVCLILDAGPSGNPSRLRRGAAFLLGLGTPLVLTLAYFALERGLGAFIEYNFLMNARWKARLPPWGVLEELLAQNPVVFAMAALGVIAALGRSVDLRRSDPGERLLSWTAASLLAGLLVIPVPHRQYALAFLPAMAVFAARHLVWMVKALSRLSSARERVESALSPRERLSLGVSGSAVVAALAYARPTLVHPLVLPVAASLAAGFLLVLLRRRKRDVALAVLVVLLSLHPFYQSRVFWETRSWATLQNLAYVLQNTTPRESVLDGFSGLGVFRPHAFFYFFLHDEVRLMLRDRDWEGLARGLREGTIAPKLVLYDRHLEQAPKPVRDAIVERYLPIGRDPIRALFPLDDDRWVDEGERPMGWPPVTSSPIIPYVLVEEGWHLPEQERDLFFRPSRGRRSHIRVPLRHPRDLVAVFNARGELDALPVGMELAVNGSSVGSIELSPGGWRHYTFRIPGGTLRPTLNDFLLTYSSTPFQADPESRGRNTTVSVESLTLLPAR